MNKKRTSGNNSRNNSELKIKKPHPPPLVVILLKKLAHKKYSCIDCKKEFYKYQMYICKTCNKPTFCNKCKTNISSYICKIT